MKYRGEFVVVNCFRKGQNWHMGSHHLHHQGVLDRRGQQLGLLTAGVLLDKAWQSLGVLYLLEGMEVWQLLPREQQYLLRAVAKW